MSDRSVELTMRLINGQISSFSSAQSIGNENSYTWLLTNDGENQQELQKKTYEARLDSLAIG